MILNKQERNYMKRKKIKYGIIGVGYLGKFHLKHLLKINQAEVSGIYDANIETSIQVSKKFKVKRFETLDELFENVQAVSIVTPTINHMDVALKALEHNCHVFIEKPIADNIKNGLNILNAVKKKNYIAHIGHIERFNPAFKAFMAQDTNPLFLECHRLSKFNERSMDISVVLDLMIHDIDLVLNMIESPIKEIMADGINVISNSLDLANAKLIFENGCVVNLTASRISNKEMRKIRVFEKQCYSNIDLLNKELTKYYADYNERDKKVAFQHKNIAIKNYDALNMELTHFCNTILNETDDLNNITKAVEALQIAEQINDIITVKLN